MQNSTSDKQTSRQLSKEQIQQLNDADWRERLSKEEYQVLRKKGTERPFTGQYNGNATTDGVYRCKGCGAELFATDNQFDAGCGWPSFDKTLNETGVDEHVDDSLGMRRIEVTCSNCGGHLGHVFPDGPQDTTGLRYCINSVAIDLEPKA